MSANLNDAQISTISLLDAILDDMNDMPTWSRFPAGVYKVKPSVKTEVKKNQAGVSETHITISCKLLAVVELADAASVAPEVGSETQVRYTWENEYGQGGLKNLLKPVAAASGQKSVPVLLDLINNADDLVFVMDIRAGKADAKGVKAEYQTFTDLIVQ